MAKQPLIPPFGKKVHLKDYDPDYSGEFDEKDDITPYLEKDLNRLIELQEILFAERKRSLLVVLQATDAGGKDGTIEHVFKGVNPQGVNVASFKTPTPEELAHDFLWRIHKETPENGYIVVFNRSHYEDILAVRIYDILPKKVWKTRYDRINQFEEYLLENNTTILKFFLHISKDEQKKRFEERLNDPRKQWKFSVDDVEKRKYWDDYIEAAEDVLTKCNTEYAPWHIVPANHKWYRNYIITHTIVKTLEDMNLKYPNPIENIKDIKIPD